MSKEKGGTGLVQAKIRTPDKMNVWNHSRPRPAESVREGAFDGKRAVDGAAIHTAARDSGFLEKVLEKVKFSVAIWERI
jgi:hypothetical protein